MEPERAITEWLRSDPARMAVLRLASTLNLDGWCIAAGFVRNLVWDKLHGKCQPTPLNDIDLIYYDSSDTGASVDRRLELRLQADLGLPWSVKNQARMHARNFDRPYLSTCDAMSYWVEIETAVGVALSDDGEIEIVAPFGIDSLFERTITLNRKRPKPCEFHARIETKKWLRLWPELQIVA